MVEPQESIGSPVKDFVSNFISQVEDGLKAKGWVPCAEQEAHTKIDLTATEVKEVGGGLKIHVFSLGGKASDSQSQKMVVFAKKIDVEVEKIKRDTEIAVAKKSKQLAEEGFSFA